MEGASFTPGMRIVPDPITHTIWYLFRRYIYQKTPSAEGDGDREEGKEGGREPLNDRAEAKYGGDSEAAAAAKSSARARAATLGDSSACEAEV